MTPRPPIFHDIIGFGGRSPTKDGPAAAEVGGMWGQPNLGLAYLLAARHVIAEGEREQRLREVALPVAFLQRHAMELALKDLLETAYEIQRDRGWLAALQQDSDAEPGVRKTAPFKHDFKKLRKLVRGALKAIGFDLPDDIDAMTMKLGTVEMFDPSRFRYLTGADGEKSFPESEVLHVGQVQADLEALFEKHFHFQGFDRPNTEWNLATDLAAEGEYLTQAIYRIVDPLAEPSTPATSTAEAPRPASDVSLLAMDESLSDETGIASLTGVVIPVEHANEIREEIYRFARHIQALPPNHFGAHIELHGSQMLKGLPWATDEHRLRCYEHVVETVNRYQLDVVRVAYRRTKTLTGMFQGDEKLHGLCFLGVAFSMGRFLPDTVIVPIMDGLQEKLASRFGSLVQNADSMRAGGIGPENISIAASHNLMEPLFASSRYSTSIQLADVVAYLLHILDYERAGLPLSPFKRQLVDVAHKLDMSIIAGLEPLQMEIVTSYSRDRLI